MRFLSSGQSLSYKTISPSSSEERAYKENQKEAQPNIFSYGVFKRGWVVKSDKPHLLLDLVEGLSGNSPGPLSAIKENTGYISGFSG